MGVGGLGEAGREGCWLRVEDFVVVVKRAEYFTQGLP